MTDPRHRVADEDLEDLYRQDAEDDLRHDAQENHHEDRSGAEVVLRDGPARPQDLDDELRELSKDDRHELAKLAAQELGVELEQAA